MIAMFRCRVFLVSLVATSGVVAQGQELDPKLVADLRADEATLVAHAAMRSTKRSVPGSVVPVLRESLRTWIAKPEGESKDKDAPIVALVLVDALIRRKAKLPVAELEPLRSGRSHAAALILAANDPNGSRDLLWRELRSPRDWFTWSLAGQHLSALKDPRFVRWLASTTRVRIEIRVGQGPFFGGRRRSRKETDAEPSISIPEGFPRFRFYKLTPISGWFRAHVAPGKGVSPLNHGLFARHVSTAGGKLLVGQKNVPSMKWQKGRQQDQQRQWSKLLIGENELVPTSVRAFDWVDEAKLLEGIHARVDEVEHAWGVAMDALVIRKLLDAKARAGLRFLREIAIRDARKRDPMSPNLPKIPKDAELDAKLKKLGKGLRVAQREFADRFIKALRADGYSDEIRFDSSQFALNLQGGTVMFLANHRAELAALESPSEAEIDAFILARARTVTRLESIPTDFAKARESILPRVKGGFGLTNLAMRAAGRKPIVTLSRPLADDLVEYLCWDGRRTIQYLRAEELESWKQTRAAVQAVALANLAVITKRPFSEVRPGVFESPYKDNHDASRLLLVDRIAKLAVKGRPVAIVPDRDTLLITGDLDDAGLAFAASRAKSVWESTSRAVSGFAYRLEDGKWRRFVPIKGEAVATLRALAWQSLSSAYADQKQSLEKIHEREGEDIFVGSVMMIERNGRQSSLCVWTRGIASLLPRTELVALVDPSRPKDKQILGPFLWKRLASVVGAKVMRPVADLSPPRIEVREFPTAAMLEKLALGR